jgi:hypothetical protein
LFTVRLVESTKTNNRLAPRSRILSFGETLDVAPQRQTPQNDDDVKRKVDNFGSTTLRL